MKIDKAEAQFYAEIAVKAIEGMQTVVMHQIHRIKEGNGPPGAIDFLQAHHKDLVQAQAYFEKVFLNQ